MSDDWTAIIAAIDKLKSEEAERRVKREETHGWLGADDLHDIREIADAGLSLPGGTEVGIPGEFCHIFGSVVDPYPRTKESCPLPWEPREKI